MVLTTMERFDTLVAIALDLTAALSADDRHRRLLQALSSTIPYDAAALLRLEGEDLVPVAIRGLSADVLGRRYRIEDHPRLAAICKAREPIRFAATEPSPDPFDGQIEGDPTRMLRVHACLGCPLILDERLIGVLTADALDPGSFDRLDQKFLRAVGALAASQMRAADLMKSLEACAEKQGLIARDLVRDLWEGRELIGHSRAIEHLRREILLVAASDYTVLVSGDTGVGKELVVRAVHAASPRRNDPLLYLNCAALPESLAESELFGHTRGAFTGATRDRPGKFEMADGGSLFLDEIGELPPPIQPKLLRVIQDGEIQRLGSDHTMHVNVRILAATNRNLEEEVKAGRFRPDLFHRLNIYPLAVPPLAERREDIPLLAGHFCEATQRRLGLGPVRICRDALDLLERYNWPGNVRELENVISRAILKAGSQTRRGDPVVVTHLHLDGDIGSAGQSCESAIQEDHPPLSVRRSFRDLVEDFQRDLIRRTVLKHHGNWAAAARELGMHRGNLHNLATRLGVRRIHGPTDRD
jgi:anaerobic nitric oxide reductase transcription regulator